MSGPDMAARGLAARAATLADRARPQILTGTLPAGLGWDVARWPMSFGMHVPAQGRPTGWCSITFDSLFPGWRSRTTVYCDGTNGNDNNSGLTSALSVKTLSRALTVANGLADMAVALRVTAGIYHRAANFYFGNIAPAKDMVISATGGRVIVTSADTPTFTADSANAATWTTSLANCNGVADLTVRDGLNRYVMLTQVASAAVCALTPGSWALVSGTLTVRRVDGAQPTAANSRVYRPQDNFQANGDTHYNIGFTGDTDADGFDFEGGNIGSISLNWTGTTLPASQKIFAMQNCSVRYPGAMTGAAGLIRTINHHGLVFLDRCGFGLGLTDSINVHTYTTTAGFQTYLLTVNCSAHDSGSNLYQSCNAWTLHENTIGVDICGDYQRAKGCTVHIINTARALVYGTSIGGSQGDRQAGGGQPMAELRTDNDAVMWVDNAVLTPSGTPGCEALAGGPMWFRNMPPPRAPRVTAGTGTIGGW